MEPGAASRPLNVDRSWGERQRWHVSRAASAGCCPGLPCLHQVAEEPVHLHLGLGGPDDRILGPCRALLRRHGPQHGRLEALGGCKDTQQDLVAVSHLGRGSLLQLGQALLQGLDQGPARQGVSTDMLSAGGGADV